jgi:hypothetical protein
MVVPESQVISTFLMQNFWRNDSWVLTNFLAYDWNAGALIAGPSFRWVMSNNLFLDFGINLLFGGRDQRHNVRDLCADGSLECLRDPDTWNPGQWQTLNQDLKRFARTPYALVRAPELRGRLHGGPRRVLDGGHLAVLRKPGWEPAAGPPEPGESPPPGGFTT